MDRSLLTGLTLRSIHVRPRVCNGTTDLTNLEFLHRHCHHQRSVLDGSSARRDQEGLHAKNRATEEPNAAKVGTFGSADESFPRRSGRYHEYPHSSC